ncbi:hypothetical protein BCR44DRAFT_55077 [Catenaria anguillulae PL171]|uniref:Uncharacterized protein n=1 Tax=Catenaria anguillulae PL171 TaxID=765915 RepID=A0A1Y2I2B0_9FUNG|nr:hypothetical protein BCR44DRAFT_55077 [Catenaria anguillulae PL171]
MTKPRRKQTKAERDQAPVVGKNDRQRDMPGRFRLVMAMQKQMEERDQQKKAAKKAGKPVPKRMLTLTRSNNPKSAESLPPPTHVRPSAADDPAVSGKKKESASPAGTKETKSTSSSSKAKSGESNPTSSKSVATSAAPEADNSDAESKLSASARRRKRRLEAEARVAKEEQMESTEPSRKRPRKQDFDELEDSVEFGEVVQAPPTLKVSKKMQKRKMERILADEVAQNAVKTGGKSAAEKRQMDDERNRMIQLYRDLKAKRDMDRVFPSMPGRM